MVAVRMVRVRKISIGETAANLMRSTRWVRNWLHRYDEGGFDSLRDLPRSSRSMQTRLERLTAEKHRTASADLMRQYGTRLEKARKSPLAAARLQAGRSSRASLQADSQTPGSSPASAALQRDADDVVGCRDMQTTSKRPYRVTVARMTPVSSPDGVVHFRKHPPT